MKPLDRSEQTSGGSKRGIAFIAGVFLITLGSAYLLEQYLQTGWLALVLIPAIGITFLVGGVRSRRLAYIIPGGLITGLGMGAFFLLSRWVQLGWQAEVAGSLISFALGWALIVLLSYILFRRWMWWAFLVGLISLSLGLVFLLSPLRFTDFVLYIVTGVGIALLIWGVYARLFGLIIPGCLLIGIGPGIYTAWSGVSEPSSLSRTGIMLVSFALGWGLITVFSRVVTTKFVWWPLIPGGVLAMTGWGLYIGGNPGNALSFIGNTGSIGLIIFGIYLLLLRRGIHS